MKNLYIILLTSIVTVLLFDGCGGSLLGKKKPSVTSQARHKSTMRPYEVLGKAYEPVFIKVGESMRGISSWYGPTFHGKYTSNGEVYDMHEMTAAHKTWPMDTMVKVQNHDNGKSVVVRITDRGPFVDGRIIDCSYAAGKAIGLDRSGIANVTITAVSFKSKLNGSYASSKPTPTQTIEPVKTVQVTSGLYSIQVGSFKDLLVAQNAKSKYENIDPSKGANVKSFLTNDGSHVYRVFVGGFESETEARDFIIQHNLQTNIVTRG